MKRSIAILIVSLVILICFIISGMAFGVFFVTGHDAEYPIGKDTVKYWNDGEYQIGRLPSYYTLDYAGVDTILSYVTHYRQDASMVYIAAKTRNMYCVISLDTETYIVFDGTDAMNEELREIFSNLDQFTRCSVKLP